MKKLLILGGSEFQIPLLVQAKRMGLQTCLLDVNENAAGIPWADEYHPCSLLDTGTALRIARSFAPDGVTVGMCDVAVCTAAAICRELGLPGLPPGTARRAVDKALMIRAFHSCGVPHPDFRYLRREEIGAWKPDLDFPVISKPVDMAGSRGVRISRTAAELPAALAASSAAGISGHILAEEYMTGPEVSVELLVRDGTPHVLQVTDKLTSGAPHFTEVGHVQPSSLPEEKLAEVRAVACAAALSLGLENSLAHAELILTQSGPKMVELGARMGGDGIQEQLIGLSTGINVPEIAIRLALGEPVPVPEPTERRACAIGFLPSSRGRVRAIQGLDRAAGEAHVAAVKALCREGDELGEAVDNSGRSAYVITCAGTAAEALEACRTALRDLKLELY